MSLLYAFDTSVDNQVVIYVCVYFLDDYSDSLIHVSIFMTTLLYCTTIVLLDVLKIKTIIRLSSYSSLNGYYQNNRIYQMLMEMWRIKEL
jgi:hypothetical protein